MRGLRAELFADPEDLRRLLEAFRSLGDFRYTAMTAVNEQPAQYGDPVDLLRGGLVSPAAPNRGLGYMVTDASMPIATRKIEMTNGPGFKVLLDQGSNPSSVRIALGGDAGDETLISSIVDTPGETDRAREIHAIFKRAIAKESSRICGRYVMPAALSKLQRGWRLTAGKEFHRDLDLKQP